MPDVSWTVIGGGLAGSLICLELARLDRRVIWYADPARPPCSRVAAGMYNPITGKRFARTWQVDVLQPFMESYYRDLEETTGSRFFYPQPVLKLFTDPGERERWEQRRTEEDFQRLARPLPSAMPGGIRDAGLGGFLVPRAGSVRLPVLLEAVRSFLAPKVEIRDMPYPDSTPAGHTVVHCVGWHAVRSPELSGLPFRHAHGEVLTIEAEGLDDTFILNTGVYVLPLGGGSFRVGATYDWDRLDPAPTRRGREELEARLDQLLTVPYRVTDHEAGIRPATKRRTPVLGYVPGRPGHAVFNGLGSKGVLLAPYYARQLARHLVLGSPLDRDVDAATHAARA